VEEDTLAEDHEDEPEQLILTVEYTRAALTALLVVEECGVFEHRRVLHDNGIGADHLSHDADRIRSDLVHALRNVTKLPLQDGNGEGLAQISNLVLLGESAGDSQLHDALKEAPGEKMSGLSIMTVSDGITGIIDPTVAASRGVAQDCWDRADFKDDESD
jgi:hypothetical protein